MTVQNPPMSQNREKKYPRRWFYLSPSNNNVHIPHIFLQIPAIPQFSRILPAQTFYKPFWFHSPHLRNPLPPPCGLVCPTTLGQTDFSSDWLGGGGFSGWATRPNVGVLPQLAEGHGQVQLMFLPLHFWFPVNVMFFAHLFAGTTVLPKDRTTPGRRRKNSQNGPRIWGGISKGLFGAVHQGWEFAFLLNT